MKRIADGFPRVLIAPLWRSVVTLWRYGVSFLASNRCGGPWLEGRRIKGVSTHFFVITGFCYRFNVSVLNNWVVVVATHLRLLGALDDQVVRGQGMSGSHWIREYDGPRYRARREAATQGGGCVSGRSAGRGTGGRRQGCPPYGCLPGCVSGLVSSAEPALGLALLQCPKLRR
jgi:hypothetical protein